ncbi:MAG: twin-arginine translocation signal domain-containing protein, partial [Bauldia sp.]|nr:twin-arginine translocation signal domain-containing protein [Bauldia sp.]
MSKFELSRRKLLQGGAALGAVGLTSGILPIRSALAAPLTIGIVYVGPRDDFGWNQAHAV